MLVSSTELKIVATPSITGHTSDPTMAPVTDPFPVPGLEGLILKNCRFFSSPDTELSLVVAKEKGQFRAVVLQTKENFRGPLLVDTGPTIYWVLHSLMVKSAESVQNYIQISGYSIVPRTRETKADKEAHGFGDSEHGFDDNQGHDAESVISRSTSCTLPCCETHKKETRRPRRRGRSLRWRSASTFRENSYSRSQSRSRSRSRGRCRASLSTYGSNYDSRRVRSGGRSSSSSRRSNVCVNSGPTYTSQSVLVPPKPPVTRHSMPYHNRVNGASGVDSPPLPPPPPGWPLRNMGLNGGVGNGVNHASPPYHPPPPPPPPLLPDGFASAGSGKEPCWSFQQLNHFQSQNRSCHGQAMRPTDQYLRPGSIQHVQLPPQVLPATTATQSVPPAFSAIDVAVPGSNPKPNGHSLKPGQSQHHIPPPPPPPPPFPPMSRVVDHVYGSAPWHVQRSRAYTTAGIIPPPPPPPPLPPTSIHVPSSSSISSSSSATTTITPNASPNLPSVAPRFFQGASSTTSSSPSAPSTSTSSSPNPTANQNSIKIPCSSCGDSNKNKPTSTTPPVLITIGFPSQIDGPSRLTILCSLPRLSVASIQAVVVETIDRHSLSLKGFGSNPGKEESKVRISAIKAIVPVCSAASSDQSVDDEPTCDSGRSKWRRESKVVVDITEFDKDTQLGFLFDHFHHHHHREENINGEDKSEVVVARFEVEVVVEHERSDERGGSMSSWSPAAAFGATGVGGRPRPAGAGLMGTIFPGTMPPLGPGGHEELDRSE